MGVVTAHVGRRGDGGTEQRRDSSLREATLEFTPAAAARPRPAKCPGVVSEKLGEQCPVAS